jgi:hypothetical protein
VDEGSHEKDRLPAQQNKISGDYDGLLENVLDLAQLLLDLCQLECSWYKWPLVRKDEKQGCCWTRLLGGEGRMVKFQ